MSDTPVLVAQLRRRLKDERVGRTGFRISCVDTYATDCLLTVNRARHFITQPINARDAAALDLDLGDPRYATLRLLIEFLQTQKGYRVEVDKDYVADHPSMDIELAGSASILNELVMLRHHLFTDDELEEIIGLAAQRHNVSYTAATVPETEYTFVLQLAHAIALRELATDATKRKELEFTSDKLLEIARDEEESYRSDVRRQARVLPSAAPLDQANPGRGDVVVSASYRRSLRTGYQAPIAAALPPTAPVLETPDNKDVGDTTITLSWTRNRDLAFYSMELWRDTRPGIQRPELVSLNTDTPQLQRQSIKRPFTPRLCFRSAGPHSTWEHVGGIVVLNEEGGQTIVGFTDCGAPTDDPRQLGPATAPPLEPNTTYYYRLFVVSLNDEIIGSNEIVVTTKPMRALISADKNALTPASGVGGVACTLLGTGFDATTKVTIGGKAVTNLVLVSPTQLTFNAPVFSNPSAVGLQYDVVVISGDGQIDVLGNGFKLTS